MTTFFTYLAIAFTCLLVGVYWPGSFPWFFFTLLGLLAIARFSREVNQVFRALYTPVHALDDARAYLDGRMAAVGGKAAGIRSSEGLEPESVFISRVVGIVLAAGILASFLFSETYLTLETLRVFSSADLPELSLPGLPVQPETVLAACLLLGPIFWGTVLTDLAGKTSFGPWARLSPHHRQVLGRTAWGVLVGFCCLAVLLGIFRGMMSAGAVGMPDVPLEYGMEQDGVTGDVGQQQALETGTVQPVPDDAYTTGDDRFMRLVALAMYPSLAVLVLITAVAAGYCIAGVVLLTCLLGLALLQAVLWLAALVFRLLYLVGITMCGAVQAIVDLLLAMGRMLLNWMDVQPGANAAGDRVWPVGRRQEDAGQGEEGTEFLPGEEHPSHWNPYE